MSARPILNGHDRTSRGVERGQGATSCVHHVNPWRWRRVTLVVGSRTEKSAVADNNSARVEDRAFVELHRHCTIAGKLPGDALGDHSDTVGPRGVHEVRRPLASHSVVGRSSLEDVRGVVWQVGQLVDHHVRGKPVHNLEQHVAIEYVTDDGFGAERSQLVHLARSAGHPRDVIAFGNEQRNEVLTDDSARSGQEDPHSSMLRAR